MAITKIHEKPPYNDQVIRVVFGFSKLMIYHIYGGHPPFNSCSP